MIEVQKCKAELYKNNYCVYEQFDGKKVITKCENCPRMKKSKENKNTTK